MVPLTIKALIFTEGGKKIGFGHITRCLALKDAFVSQGIQARLIVHGDNSVRKQFRGQPDMVFDWLSEKARTRGLLKGASIVAVDSYLAPADFYKTISLAAPVPVYIDDFARLSYPLGTVVNSAIGAEKVHYPRNKKRRYLLGAKHALLRKDFWKVAPKNSRKNIRNVLITFGGVDRTVFIKKMLDFIQPRFKDWHFHVIAAQSHHRTYPSNKQVSFYSGLSAKKMMSLMARCDIAISGGGQTTHELAACGLPAVGICFAKNQRLNIRDWQQAGFLKYAGRFDDPPILRSLARALRGMTFKRRCSMGRIGQKVVDGAGALRTASGIFDTCFGIQNVRMSDRKQIFEWSNSPAARSASFNQRPINWASHCQWFKAKLKNPRCSFLKVLLLGRPIGQVRFDRFGRIARISITLDERYRGKGLGGPAVQLATQHIFKVAPDIRAVNAFVKKDNVASQKTFLKAGFRFAGIKKIDGQTAYHFTRSRYEKASI